MVELWRGAVFPAGMLLVVFLLRAAPAWGQSQPINLTTIPRIPAATSKPVKVHYRATLNPNTPVSSMALNSDVTVSGTNFSPFGPVTATVFAVVEQFVLRNPLHFFWNGF